MPPVQVEEAPPSLRSAVEHRENPHERGELTGCGRAPLLHHQVRDVCGLAGRPGRVLCSPVPGGEECASAFERGAIERHGDDHEETRYHREGVSRAMSQ